MVFSQLVCGALSGVFFLCLRWFFGFCSPGLYEVIQYTYLLPRHLRIGGLSPLLITRARKSLSRVIRLAGREKERCTAGGATAGGLGLSSFLFLVYAISRFSHLKFLSKHS